MIISFTARIEQMEHFGNLFPEMRQMIKTDWKTKQSRDEAKRNRAMIVLQDCSKAPLDINKTSEKCKISKQTTASNESYEHKAHF